MDPIPMQAVVALVGPDDAQRVSLRQHLDLMGHASVVFRAIDDFMTALRTGRRFDLLVLAWPSDANWDSLRAVRDTAAVPVLLVLEMQSLLRVPGRSYFLGSNIDFVTWPADGQKFEWSVQGMLARFGAGVPKPLQKNEVVCGDFRFLVPQRAVSLLDGRQIQLKPREFELALQLFLNMGRLLPRDWLWSTLWGRAPREGERSLDVCVAGVRRALSLRAENGLVLNAIYKRGYRLDPVQ